MSRRKTGLYISSRSSSQHGLTWSKYVSFCYIIRHAPNSDPFATNLGLIIDHHKLGCPCEKLVTAFRVNITVKVQVSMNVCPDNKFWTQWFLTILGMVMHHCGSECHAKRLFSRSRLQGGLIKSNIMFLPYVLNCWSFWNQIQIFCTSDLFFTN